jgi:hypothetical protein
MSQRECAGFNGPPLSPRHGIQSAFAKIRSLVAAVRIWKPALVGSRVLHGAKAPSRSSHSGCCPPDDRSCSPGRLASATPPATSAAQQPLIRARSGTPDRPCGPDVGVGQLATPVRLRSATWESATNHNPLSDVRRAEARSAEIERPDGVTRSFHVSLNKVEPSKSVLARNLLAKDDARSALFNEIMERRP